MSTWWLRQPLAYGALAAIAGILIAEATGWQERTWVALTMLVGVAGLVGGKSLGVSRTGGVLLAVMLGFGFWHQQRLQATYEHPLLRALEAAGELDVVLEARVLRAEAALGGQVRLQLQTGEVRSRATGEVLGGPCRLRAWLGQEQAALLGGRARVSGRLLPLRAALNEGEFSARDFGLRSGFLGEVQVREAEALEESAWRAWLRHVWVLAERCRVRILERLVPGLEGRPDELTVIQAMALGASEDTDPRVEEPFRGSGTLHVFAVSGLHVGLIALILRRALLPLRLRRPVLVAVVIPLVFAYAFITGWRPSAARAAWMIAILLLGSLVERRGALLNGLGAAALLLMIWDTHVLFLAGFQLSFGVLLAIALLAGWFWEKMEPWVELDPFLPSTLATPRQRFGLGVRRFASGLLGTSCAAWTGSLPLMWFHFYTITPVGLLANCLLVPAAFVCLSLACASVGASFLPFGGGLQTWLNGLNGHCAAFMLTSAETFARLPGAHAHLPPPTQWLDRSEVELRVMALPYGAEAALLRVGGRFWMLDAGAANDYGRVVLPTLRRAGVNRLAGLVLSHADASHLGGVEPLLRALPVAGVWHPQHEPWAADSGATRMRQLLEKTAPLRPQTRFEPLKTEQSLELEPGGDLRPARLTVLYPTAADRQSLADDRGLVARVEVGALRVLWTADAGFVTEKALLDRRVDLRCDVLVRGAHSVDFHGTSAFLEAAAPQLILNAGPERPPGGKAPSSVRAYAARQQIPLLFLSESGGVRLRLRDDEATRLHVETFVGDEDFEVSLR